MYPALREAGRAGTAREASFASQRAQTAGADTAVTVRSQPEVTVVAAAGRSAARRPSDAIPHTSCGGPAIGAAAE